VVGAGDGFARTGPNLLGVTSTREHAWLTRWLKEPDRMLAEKDPLALELFAQYRNVPMPNMRLNEFEIASLLEFIEEESVRQAAVSTSAKAEEQDVPACCRKDEVVVISHATPPAVPPALLLARLPVPRSDAEHAPGTRALLVLGLTVLLAAASAVLRSR
jgi:hypothetical protein